MNAEALKLFGAHNKKEIIGMPVRDRLHPDFQKIADQRISNLNVKKLPQKPIEQIILKLNSVPVNV